jgi:hypothetical protein
MLAASSGAEAVTTKQRQTPETLVPAYHSALK